MRILLISSLLILASCGTTKKIDNKALKKVKTVAVLVYSVPEIIEFKENPRGKKDEEFSILKLATSILKGATNGVGSEAATISYDQFVKTLEYEKLPFKVLTMRDLKKNKKFKNLAAQPKVAKVEEKKTGWMSMATGMMGIKPEIMAHSPNNLQAFGLSKNWWDRKALMGTTDEKAYIAKVIKDLGVDAVMVINDPGFTFSCKPCIGGTGTASTGSAFNISLIGKDGKEILNVRQWFSYTPENSAIVAGIVNPNTQKSLFKAHGEKTAKLFSEEFKTALKEKE